MDLLSDALAPEQLAIPESVLATTVASEIVGGVLTPGRTARVVAFYARDPSLPSLEEVVGRLVDDGWNRSGDTGEVALVRVVQNVVVDELLALAVNVEATTEARAAAEWGLQRARARAVTASATGAADPTAATVVAHVERMVSTIDRFLERPWAPGQRTEAPQGPGWARDRPVGNRWLSRLHRRQ